MQGIAIERTCCPDRFPIDRQDGARGRERHPFLPAQTSRFKLRGIDPAEDPAKGVMRRDTGTLWVWQVQPRVHPRLRGVRPIFDLDPAFRSTDHPAQGERDDIEQGMTRGSRNTGIDQIVKTLGNTG